MSNRDNMWMLIPATAIIYIVFALASQSFSLKPDNISPVWIPSGLMIAIALRYGFRAFPGIAIGAFLGNIWAYVDFSNVDLLVKSIIAGVCNGIGDASAWTLAAYFIKRFLKFRPAFSMVSDVLILIPIAFLGSLVSAIFGVGALYGLGLLPEFSDSSQLFRVWLFGDFMGAIFFTPLVLLLSPSRSDFKWASTTLFLCVLGLALTIIVVASQQYPASILIFLIPVFVLTTLYIGNSAGMVLQIFSFALLLMNSSNLVEDLISVQILFSMVYCTTLILGIVNLNRVEALAKVKNLVHSRDLLWSTVSHEMRTPLHGILGASSIIEKKNLTEDQQQHLQTIQSSGELMLSLINGILDWRKTEIDSLVLKREHVDIRALVASCIRIVQTFAREKDLSIHFHVDSGIQFFKGDSNRLKQIILNLLANAVKFTNKGTVELSARMELASNHKKFVRLSVKDTGIGISEKDRVKVFKPFEQLLGAEKFGGTGLGLSICKLLIERMNGKIGYDSKVGVGSNFWFLIPFIPSSVDEVKPPGLKTFRTNEKFDNALKNRQKNTRVCVIDDDPINLRILSSMLESIGVECVTYTDPLLGLESLKNENFDLALIDLNIPNMDGLKIVSHYLESMGPKRDWDKVPTKLILMSASDTLSNDKSFYYHHGFDATLQKPFRMEDLAKLF